MKDTRNKYYLVGIPTCGKTTLGRRVSEHMDMAYFDTDDMAADQVKKENNERFSFFSYLDSVYDEQKKAIVWLSTFDSPAIVATGAEIALIPDCVELMRSTGFIIFIDRILEKILDAMQDNPPSGPVMAAHKDDGSFIYMHEERVKIYESERPKYRAIADYTLDNNGSEDEGAEKLAALIRALSLDG